MTWEPASLLMSRFGFGIEAKTRAAIAANGMDAWWNSQIQLGRTTGAIYDAVPAIAAQGPMLKLTPAQIRARLASNGNDRTWDAMTQLANVTLGLQAWSPASVYEATVDFFANHLNVANFVEVVWITRHLMDRDVIRKFAFGSFTDMLLASAKDPAMLTFLSLAQSTKTDVNENYGRELLELHTVGLGAGFTESDVQNSAKILTGRTLDADYNYVYNPAKHWTGPVKVLGFSHPNSDAAGGEAVGDAYLKYLASHPSTANHLAQKLCVRFVADNPTPSLVAAVAKAYLDSGTQIVPMLETIVRSTDFWSSRGWKVRRPLENLMATVRTLGVGMGDLKQTLPILSWMSANAGQRPLEWSAPNGYPDVAASWRSSGALVSLWSYHRGLAKNWWPTAFDVLDATTLYGGVTPKTSGEAVTVLCTRLTGGRFPAAHEAALQTFLGEPASTPMTKSNMTRYLTDVIALILDAPQHSLR